MPPTFIATGATVAEKLGFDDTTAPPWVMVPVDGTKKLVLRDGNGLTLMLRNPADKSVIAFREEAPSNGGRVIVLTAGRTPKTILLDAKDSGGITQASVEITIKAQVRLSTFIGFVFDKSHRASVRGLTAAEQVMDLANTILVHQTNVKMFRSDSGGVRLPFDMPRGMPADFPNFAAPTSWDRPGPGMLLCVSSRPLGPEGCLPEETQGSLKREDFEALRNTQMLTNIVNRIDARFDYNIFFVRNLDGGTGIAAATAAFTPRTQNAVEINLCFMPDTAGFQSLAHELCHFLLRSSPIKGPGRHSSGRFDLMVANPGPDQIRIPKSQANVINPSGFP